MPDLDRRTFLSLLGAGTAGAGVGFWFNQMIRPPVEHLIPQVVAPEDISPGTPVFYNSVCGLCSAGCGITVKTREGRAKKIEGNPGHPVNQGGLCATGQAGLNLLYHPDRIRSPLKRVGDRGNAEFMPASWAEVIAFIGHSFQTLKGEGRSGQIHFCSRPVQGHLDSLLADYFKQLGTSHYVFHQRHSSRLQQLAMQQCFQQAAMPFYDIAHCDLLLSFGADFLHSGSSPVMMARQYGEFRRKTPRGHFIQLEARMSATGANADQWLAARPGSEAAIALYLAQQLLARGRYQGADREAWQNALQPHSLAKAAEVSGLAESQLQALADAVISRAPLLALCGETPSHTSNGFDTAIAVLALNYLAGAQTGQAAMRASTPSLIPSVNRQVGKEYWQQLRQDAKDKRVAALLLHECNPLFDLPAALEFEAVLNEVPLVVAFSNIIDESNAYADWILPVPSYLERWDDIAAETGGDVAAASVGQPTVVPLYDTRHCGDIVLSLAAAQGEPMGHDSYRLYLQQRWQTIHQQLLPNDLLVDFDTFWQTTLTSGVFGKNQSETPPLQWRADAIEKLQFHPIHLPGEASEFPFLLQLYPQYHANHDLDPSLPWLQELPDPMTGVVYHNWLEIHPKTAQEKGLRDGDIVRVATANGELELPIYSYPGIAPDMLAIPVGRGHSQLGRYSKRGANPMQLIGVETVQGCDELAWSLLRAQITPTGRRLRVPRVGEHERSLGRNLFGGQAKTIPIKEL